MVCSDFERKVSSKKKKTRNIEWFHFSEINNLEKKLIFFSFHHTASTTFEIIISRGPALETEMQSAPKLEACEWKVVEREWWPEWWEGQLKIVLAPIDRNLLSWKTWNSCLFSQKFPNNTHTHYWGDIWRMKFGSEREWVCVWFASNEWMCVHLEGGI